ncbi:MAG: efflux RND transporter periplasmic adaptor subunit, partial [Microscillaceae bacterium]|nr:efflux RND transporter periplasmic adaptor subunit [Microscillaceae bacterium]
RATFREEIRASGRLELQNELFLSFKTGGLVAQVFARKGDRVRRGQLLARLDPAQAQEQYRQARENFQRYQADVARLQKLYETEKIGRLQELEKQQTALEIAQSNLNLAQTGLNELNLLAPNDGLVLDKFMEPGELASPGKPVFKLSGAGEAYVFKVGLPDREAVKIKLGDSARIYFSAYPDQPLLAVVSRIPLSANPQNGLYEAEITFAAEGWSLKPGFIGEVRIFAGLPREYALVPPEALVDTDRRQATVYVPDAQGKPQARAVHIAEIFDQNIAIDKGLEGIEKILIP